MKIEKLYTLSQFVDFLEEKMPFFDGESELLNCAENYRAIEKYNEFLKQPLKTEMFVNEIERTTWEDVDKIPLTSESKEAAYCVLLDIWRQAEKRVIFDLIDQKNYFHPNNHRSRFFFENWLLNDFTLHNVAEGTKGNLNLKNVIL